MHDLVQVYNKSLFLLDFTVLTTSLESRCYFIRWNFSQSAKPKTMITYIYIFNSELTFHTAAFFKAFPKIVSLSLEKKT